MAESTDNAGWIHVRDQAVFIGQLSQALSVEQVEAAIAHGDRALGIGSILDPTAFMRGSDELDKQLRYLRAFLAFRREVAAMVAGPSRETEQPK